MEVAKKEVKDSPHLLVVAKMQSQARGTKGRQWLCEPGNLFMTVAIHAQIIKEASLLPVYAGLSIFKASQHFLPPLSKRKIKLKWPNDLIVEEKKAGGILIESEVPYFFVGIGINIKSAPKVGDGGRRSCCLAEYGMDITHRMEYARYIYSELIHWASHLHQREDVIKHYRDALDWKSALYTRETNQKAYWPLSIDKWGQLKARDEVGNIRMFSSEYFF